MDMLQKSAREIVEEVEILSRNRLKMKDDLLRIIELSIKNGSTPLLDETAFRAKYLQGLFGIIQRGESSIKEEVLRRYTAEYTENIEEIKKNLLKIVEGSGNFFMNIFREKYLSLTQESLSKLNRLIYDLGWYKMYLNDQKSR
ncbi:MAG: hypothetical protein HF314_08270 [Ignavibacteria bacterium]|jgi:hypothetical protein|nr:hypothetical protein [Ignavibacteria bacterium]MCU7503054.1 hypothetical protein [Ignavibacteria bacterium]MCU7516526.1 hypothetical protein [Ignavibacteria bacterium]